MEIVRWNARPRIAGFVLFASADELPVLAARAANPLHTLHAAELHALIVDTARPLQPSELDAALRRLEMGADAARGVATGGDT